MNAIIILLALNIIAIMAVMAWAVVRGRSGPGEDGPDRTAGFTDEISDDERRAYDAAVMDEMTWRDAQ